MSANVDQMFSVREMPWWIGTSEDKGQAAILGEHPQWEDARKLAGLDWDPIGEDLYRPMKITATREALAKVMFDAELSEADKLDAMMAAVIDNQQQVEGWKHIHRSDSLATLACTMESYAVITNSAFGEIFEAVLGQDNVKFETGGSLEGGRKVWMLAMLDEPLQLPGDATTSTYPYLALQSRHDAMGGTVLRGTNVRIVCANTFNAAEMSSDGKGVKRGQNGFTFVHRGDWRSRMDEAKAAVNSVRAEAKAYEAWAAEMLLVKVNKKLTERFVTEFIPAPPAGVASERVLANVEASRDKLREILASPTVAGAGIGGTGYGLVQGAGEYLDHARSARTWETKLNRTLLTPETLKGKAAKMVRELANA